MEFVAKGLLSVVRQPVLVNGLTHTFRSLSITSRFAQQQKPSLVNAPAVENRSDKTSQIEQKECQEVFNKVNSQVAARKEGRLFAIVHLCGKQFKITTGDIILVEGYWPPTTGDEIRLEKVLLAGAKDFTLIGRPLLPQGLVNVSATIIEKTLTHTKTHFKKKRRKQYMRINFQRSPNTMIRINSIEIEQNVDGSAEVISEPRLF
ncbi:39S ribosomal protein L21, mitochondrial-like [Rhagoletis pomonella]|uniref:39S ribosomal protein L21, mitochondrial-like n=1 Tax=Rhagoletis pomonella TaxID=28610 RepID=UPI0017817F7D|nr:39S ribosomal protein L21, mitochondrial-like [Rhagoletis pomonella]